MRRNNRRARAADVGRQERIQAGAVGAKGGFNITWFGSSFKTQLSRIRESPARAVASLWLLPVRAHNLGITGPEISKSSSRSLFRSLFNTQTNSTPSFTSSFERGRQDGSRCE